jgi:putative ABC transport system permease protein
MFNDLRYSLRQLRKNPGFTLVVVVTLALGIGASTAVFSVVNAVLLRALPYEDPKTLVTLWETKPRSVIPWTPAPGRLRGDSVLLGVSFPDLADWRKLNQSFLSLAALTHQEFVLTGREGPERVQGLRIEPELLELLGLEPELGRRFLAGEAQPGKDRAVMLSHGLWQRRFGGGEVLNRTLILNQQIYTIVGVLRPGFLTPVRILRDFMGKEPDLFVPLSPTSEEQRQRRHGSASVIGRLKPGVKVGQAQAEMELIVGRLRQQYPETNRDKQIAVVPLSDEYIGNSGRALLALFGAVVLVWLIACTNAANLLLARGAAHRNEMSLRSALGASRPRLARQVLTESLVLASLGGLLGALLAYWGTRVLLTLAPKDTPRLNEAGVDGLVLVFAVGLSFLTALLFGLLPALELSRLRWSGLWNAGRRLANSGDQARVHGFLVVTEVALSLILLTGAGLLVKSFWLVTSIDPGYRPQNLLALNIEPSQSRYPKTHQRVAFFSQILERVESLPGVQSAAVVTDLPLRGSRGIGLTIQDRPPRRANEDYDANAEFRMVSRNFFQTLGIPLLRGRAFNDQDSEGTAPVVAINQTMARRYWPNDDPIGKRIVQGDPGYELPWLTVVGIVGDVKHEGQAQKTYAEAYVPYLQASSAISYFLPRELVVRTASDPLSMVAALRGEIEAVDKDQPIFKIEDMAVALAESLSQRRFSMLLLLVFSLLGLALAVIGVYGVLSYMVMQRTHEIGVRIALGARSSDLLKTVIGRGASLTAIGVGIGSVASCLFSRMLASQLYGVSATDPAIFAGVALLLALVALLACWLPARRATKVDPMVALRCE